MPGRTPPFQALPSVDVLVLGAGLAGLRAALAALEFRPGTTVMLASLREAPSGSSFANRNQMLGMQVLDRSDQAERFVRRALELAPPGRANPALVHCLAEGSAEAFTYLQSCGLSFRQDGRERVPACFFPEQASAALLMNLPHAFDRLIRRLDAAGAQRIHGLACLDLLADHRDSLPRICGALLSPTDSGPALAIPARAVILATGGPASLFARDISGAGSTGCSYALLARAQANMDNIGFLQWMWYAEGANFYPIQQLTRPGARIRSDQNGLLDMPPSLSRFASERASHCPFGYGLPDSALDLFLASQLNPDGVVQAALSRVPETQQDWTAIAPAAHAGNGGARIDADSRTSCPGLFACGECATGMHGANRIGGAMVLATQVFGARAGRMAATLAAEAGYSPPATPLPLRPEIVLNHGLYDPGVESWFGPLMQSTALFGGRPGLAEAIPRIQEALPTCSSPLSALRLESGLVLLQSLLSEPNTVDYAL